MTKNIVVVGSEGYIGKNLINFLKKKKFKLHLIDSKKNKKKNLLAKNLSRYIPRYSTVIHLAALSQNSLCNKFPELGYEHNCVGTLNLIKACNKKKIKKFIFASTEWVYKSSNKTYSEKSFIDIDDLNSVYAKSKFFCEHLIKDCLKTKNKIILRFGIVFGKKQKYLSVLEQICKEAIKSNIVKIGSKKTGRRFIFIDDLCSGIVKSINFSGYKVLNLTGRRFISLNQICNDLSGIMNKKIKIIENNKNKPNIRNVKMSKEFSDLKFVPFNKSLKLIVEQNEK